MARNKQIAFFDGNESVRETKKHSSIVQIGNLTTKQERKAMNALIWMAVGGLFSGWLQIV